MKDTIVLELSRDQAGNLGWILYEQVKSLKKLQRKERDEMQPIIDDLQQIVDSLEKSLNEKTTKNTR